MRLGNGTVVDEAPLAVPALSRAHTVFDPSPELNSWAPYSALCPAMELDHVKVTVAEPVVVILPNQISVVDPAGAGELHPLGPRGHPAARNGGHGGPVVSTSAKTSEHVTDGLGVTAKVARAVPFLDVKVPTGLMTCAGVLKVNWSAGALTTEVPPGVVTVTSTVPVASAGEVAVICVAPFTDEAGRGGAELHRGGPGEARFR